MIADNREDKELTPDMVKKYLLRYKEWSREITEYENTVRNLPPAAATAQYGIEAAMPRGSGASHSDPVFRQATGLHYAPYLQRQMRAVRLIDRAIENIERERTKQVLALLLDGQTNLEIATTLDIHERTVRREKNEIIDIILGEWNKCRK